MEDLGDGMSGYVKKAMDTHNYNEVVAIKIINFTDDQVNLMMFDNEIRALD